jgi:hypothetical protein
MGSDRGVHPPTPTFRVREAPLVPLRAGLLLFPPCHRALDDTATRVSRPEPPLPRPPALGQRNDHHPYITAHCDSPSAGALSGAGGAAFRQRLRYDRGMMTQAMTRSLILVAIFGLMQTSAVAQDCYFNLTTFQPPNPSVCYAQQSVPARQTSYRGGGRGPLNRHTRH